MTHQHTINNQRFGWKQPGNHIQRIHLLHPQNVIAMPILERIMQPLIKASEARGRAEGREAAAKEFEQWKQDQISKGAVFIDTKDANDGAHGRDK